MSQSTLISPKKFCYIVFLIPDDFNIALRFRLIKIVIHLKVALDSMGQRT